MKPTRRNPIMDVGETQEEYDRKPICPGCGATCGDLDHCPACGRIVHPDRATRGARDGEKDLVDYLHESYGKRLARFAPDNRREWDE